jgi:hypothetical protein
VVGYVAIVLEDYWFTSVGGGPVYPGGTAILAIILRNTGNETAVGVVACLDLPPGFVAPSPCLDLGDLGPGEAAIAEFRVEVARDVEPGTYLLVVSLSYDGGRDRYTLYATVEEPPPPRLAVVESWAEPLGEAGSARLRLVLVLENSGNVSIRGGYGWVILPQGFTPSRARVELGAIPAGARYQLVVDGVSHVGAPGIYPVKLELRVEAETPDGVRYWSNVSLEAAIALGEPHPAGLNLVDAYWSVGGLPGSYGSRLRLVLANNDYCRVTAVYAKPLEALGARLHPYYGRLVVEPRQLLVLDLEADVYPGADEVEARIQLLTSLDCGGEVRLGLTSLNVSVPVEAGAEPVQVVAAWLNPSYTLGGRGLGYRPYILLRTLSPDTLEVLTIRAELADTSFWYGLPWATVVLQGAYGYGSVVEVQLPSLVLEAPGNVSARIIVEAVYSADGSRYMVRAEDVVVMVVERREGLRVLGYRVEYGGEPAPLLPGQRGATLVVAIYNPLATVVHLYHVEAETAIGAAAVAGIPAECRSIQPLSSCELRIRLDVGRDVRPGAYQLRLTLLYSVEEGLQESQLDHVLELRVADPAAYSPRLVVLAAWWGSGVAASRPYEAARAAPLSILVANLGDYTARSVVVGVEGYGVSYAVCQELRPGGTCTATVYVDVPPGAYTFNASVKLLYTYAVYGGVYSGAITANLSLPVAEARAWGLKLVDYGWQGGLKVYPGTRGAVLQLVVSNENPYPLLGASLTLSCSKLNISARGYVEGPLQPYGSAVVGIRLDVPGDAKPGGYRCVLETTYWLDVGDVVVERVSSEMLVLEVSDLYESVKLLKAYFPAPAGRGSRGVELDVIVAVTDQSLALVYAEAELPEGIVEAETGRNVVALLPKQVQLPVQEAAGLVAALGVPLQPPTLTLHVLAGRVTVSNYSQSTVELNVTLAVRDGWGTLHLLELKAAVDLAGRPEPVEVRLLTPAARIVNGTARLELLLVNRGQSALYDVYAILAPLTPAAYPLQAVKHLERLEPGRPVKLVYTLAYNPGGYVTGETRTLAAALTLLYRDAYGNIGTFNTSVSALLLIPPELRVRELKAYYANGSLDVSMVVVNVGGETALRTVVEVYTVGQLRSYTVLGDVEPGSEVPVRLTVAAPRMPDTVSVVVRYYDTYNSEYTVKLVAHVEPKPVPSQVQSGVEGRGPHAGEVIVAAGVLAFLAFTAAVIYSYLKRHRANLGG